jgi:cellulose synthase/poly-beta-1,6-N-acetylglucosamine synthase-like glycosyltransferase
MIEFLQISSYVLFVYYGLTNIIYLVLLTLSTRETFIQQKRLSALPMDRLRSSPLVPPISILVPARNEEKIIVDSVRSFLALEYPELEVIVVNDGSTDRTMDELRKHFNLLLTDILYVPEIPTQPVRGVYMSVDDRRLLVIDKESCGRKADAMNAALNASSSPYVCVVDADAILEKDALLRIMSPAFNDPRRVIASGGIIRIANGSTVENGTVTRVKLPRRIIEILQVIEYLRAFLVGRQGWANLGMLTIVSGAFGIFRRDVCRQIGGFRVSAIGEDMDVVVRMHRYMRDMEDRYKIAFVSDPVCWTEAPSTIRALASQRARWQNGLSDVLFRNLDMIFNRRYGRIGSLALPYQWLFEYAAPVVEIFGWGSMILAAILGVLDTYFFVQFILFGYLFGTFLSIGALFIEEMTYHRYNDPVDLMKLIVVSFLEIFPYRPMNSFWRIHGMWNYFRGNNDWQMIERVGFHSEAGTSIASDAGVR